MGNDDGGPGGEVRRGVVVKRDGGARMPKM